MSLLVTGHMATDIHLHINDITGIQNTVMAIGKDYQCTKTNSKIYAKADI